MKRIELLCSTFVFWCSATACSTERFAGVGQPTADAGRLADASVDTSASEATNTSVAPTADASGTSTEPLSDASNTTSESPTDAQSGSGQEAGRPPADAGAEHDAQTSPSTPTSDASGEPPAEAGQPPEAGGERDAAAPPWDAGGLASDAASTDPNTLTELPFDAGSARDSGSDSGSDSGTGLPDVGADAAPDAAPDTGLPDWSLGEWVQAYENESVDLAQFTQAMAQYPESNTLEDLAGNWQGAALLSAGQYAAGDVTVPQGAVLILGPGAHLTLAESAQLDVQGQLYVLGSSDARALITGAGESGFDRLRVRGGRTEFHECAINVAQVLLSIEDVGESLVEIDRCQLDHWHDSATAGLVITGSNNVWIHDTDLGLETPSDELAGKAIDAEQSLLRLESNRFAARTGRTDVVQLTDCPSDRLSRVVNNEFRGGGDDAVDADGCDILLDRNVMYGFRETTSGCLTVGAHSRAFIANNLVYDSYSALSVSAQAQALAVNNTFVGAETSVTLEDTAQLTLLGNVLWDNVSDIEVLGENEPSVTFNLLLESWPGEGNVNADPAFEVLAGFEQGLSQQSPALAHTYLYVGDLAQGTAFPVELVQQVLERDLLGQLRQLPEADFGALQRPE